MNPGAACVQTTGISRADLLRLLQEFGGDIPVQAAAGLGYVGEEAPVLDYISITLPALSMRVTEEGCEAPSPPSQARYLKLITRTPLHDEAGPRPPGAPAWLADTAALAEDSLPPPTKLPAYQTLLPWSRLWPFLRRVLGTAWPTREPDIQRLIRRLSRGESFRRLPVLSRHAWSPRAILLLDYADESVPYHRDFNALCDALGRMRGDYGLELRLLHGEPGATPDYRLAGETRLRPWIPPPADTPLFILSDLGHYAGPHAQAQWLRFGKRLNAAGITAPVLCPIPARRQHAPLQQVFEIHGWDRAVTPRRLQIAAAKMQESPALRDLLALLSLTLFAEPELLRDLRHLLPACRADVGLEAELWRHPDIVSSHTACTFLDAAARERHERALAGIAPALREQAMARVRAWHAGRVESVRMGELELHTRICPEQVTDAERQQLIRWQRATAKTGQDPAAPEELVDWLLRRDQRLPLSAKEASEEAAALCALAVKQRLDAGQDAQLPQELAARYDLRYFLGAGVADRRPCRLRQRGNELWLETTATLPGADLAELQLASNQVWIQQQETGAATPALRIVSLPRLPLRLATLAPGTESLSLEFPGAERLEFVNVPRPPWAASLRRDGRGLAAELKVGEGRSVWLRWQAPQEGEGCWLADGPVAGWREPGPIREDGFGLYAEFRVGGVTQRCRWIVPGRFLMGAPEDELGRFDRELPQHEVALTGFWLADTACTQALWRAVTGENPSRNKDDPDNPVANVSWDDSRAFFEKLNALAPGLAAGLPSEAQWEYACRAGTTTAYSFGKSITRDHEHYDQDFVNGKPVPVASFPANSWGLFEMHGNVLEWCSDWYGAYAAEPQVDPEGPAQGTLRVLRGGSWFGGAIYARSASRSVYDPSHRIDFIGLRVAPGRAGPAEPM